MNTITNPGCRHKALQYLSELTGMSVQKEIYFNSLDDMRNKPNKKGQRALLYPIYNIFVELNGKRYWCPRRIQRKGGVNVLCVSDIPGDLGMITTDFPLDVKWDKIGVVVNRKFEEFGVKIEPAGTHKDSLGGGWYQNVDMYKINDQYFADLEYACS